jgi:hypothetical protein
MLSKMKAEDGETSACQYAMIHAQLGNRAKALECPGTALQLRELGLVQLKTHPLLGPSAKSRTFRRWTGVEVFCLTVSACFPKPDGGDRLQGVQERS